MNKESGITNNVHDDDFANPYPAAMHDNMRYSLFMIHDSRTGFTLIELIVVIGITILLSSSLISYNHVSRQQLALYAEEVKLAPTVFRAKSLAMSSYIQSAGSGICGYGVHVDYTPANMGYSIFSYARPAGSDCQNIDRINTNSENIVSTFKIGNGIRFVSSPSGKTKLDDVLFIPPDPITLLNSGGAPALNGQASIVIETLDGSLSVSINVNSAGLIDF